jgi:hypothetical protein
MRTNNKPVIKRISLQNEIMYKTNDLEKDLETLLDANISLKNKRIIVKMAMNLKGLLYKNIEK